MSATHIQGNLFQDHRGTVGFVNDCDLSEVKRMYRLSHHDTNVFRGWQGHQKEQKWFHCAAGVFMLYTVQPKDWNMPTGDEIIEQFILKCDQPTVLHVPGGFVTGIRALKEGAILMVFSNLSVEESKADDFRFESSTWKVDY
jgi:dTDP-4-dehydrorhamnose 3,5-epimerase-like enzyme